MTLFGRLRSQPSGMTGGQRDTLRLSYHDANLKKHAESKASNTVTLATHFMI